ncbi:inositol phosphate kinase 1 isoform 2-T9 [Cochliomyia hominivorax]
MDFKTESHASSSSQSVDAPKELLLVLNILNEKQKLKDTQQKEQDMHQLQQQRRENRHLHIQYQHHHCGHYEQQQHKQLQQLQNSRWLGEREPSAEQRMELSQIELIYRAEGNANLVLALPQFKKVLRLPKIYKKDEQKKMEQEPQCQETQKRLHHQQQNQNKMNQQEPNKISTTGQQQNNSNAVGILTMDHYVAYISIIRCLVGNEFVFEADIVAVPNPNDRQWINEHIKPYRPAYRLGKEFGGHFGLLIPDATHLPAEFDILFPNLQRKTMSATVTTTAPISTHCSNNNMNISSSNTDNTRNICNNIFGSDTFAIEIKPKQGWLLPNDVNNLYDVNPKITQTTTRSTQPPSLSETKIITVTSKAAVAEATTGTSEKIISTTKRSKSLKSSSDSSECFTAIQNETSETKIPTKVEPMTTNPYYGSKNTTAVDNISHSRYDRVDPRCRYCSMQFLKMKQNKIIERSRYCPINLFSGNPERMCLALQALFDCPQNNLRIFKNGCIIFDDQIKKTSKIDEIFSSDKLQLIKHLLVTCLLREYDGKGETNDEKEWNINKESKNQQHTNIASTTTVKRIDRIVGYSDGDGTGTCVADGQPQSSVTFCKKKKTNAMSNTISAIKTTTSLTETEVTEVKSTLTSANPFFTIDIDPTSTSDNITTEQCLEQIKKTEMTYLPKNCVLQKILHLQSLAKVNLPFMFDHTYAYAEKPEKTYNIVFQLLEKFAQNQNQLTYYQLSPEEQYILAATALDCSIMITFCEVENIEEVKYKEPKEGFFLLLQFN